MIERHWTSASLGTRYRTLLFDDELRKGQCTKHRWSGSHHPPTHSSIDPYTHHPPVTPPIHPPRIYQFFHHSINPSIQAFVHASLHPSIHPFILLPIQPSFSQPINQSINQSIHSSVHHSVNPSLQSSVAVDIFRYRYVKTVGIKTSPDRLIIITWKHFTRKAAEGTTVDFTNDPRRVKWQMAKTADQRRAHGHNRINCYSALIKSASLDCRSWVKKQMH